MNKRKFDTLNESEKLKLLFLFLNLTFSDIEPQTIDQKKEFDYIELALQFSARFHLNREDFDMIKNLTINQIAEKICSA